MAMRQELSRKQIGEHKGKILLQKNKKYKHMQIQIQIQKTTLRCKRAGWETADE